MRVPPLLACRPCPYDPLQSPAPFGRFKHAASGHTFQMLSLLLGQLRDIHPEAFPFGASRLGLSVRIIPNIALRQTGVGAHFQQMSRRTPVFGYSLGNAASIEGKMPRRAISPCRAASCSGVISRGMPWRWMSTSASKRAAQYCRAAECRACTLILGTLPAQRTRSEDHRRPRADQAVDSVQFAAGDTTLNTGPSSLTSIA